MSHPDSTLILLPMGWCYVWSEGVVCLAGPPLTKHRLPLPRLLTGHLASSQWTE